MHRLPAADVEIARLTDAIVTAENKLAALFEPGKPMPRVSRARGAISRGFRLHAASIPKRTGKARTHWQGLLVTWTTVTIAAGWHCGSCAPGGVGHEGAAGGAHGRRRSSFGGGF